MWPFLNLYDWAKFQRRVEFYAENSSGPAPDPIKEFQGKIFLYAGIWPIAQLKQSHVTDVIGLNFSVE